MQCEGIYFFQVFWRIFCGCAAKNRAIRGSGFASGPGAARRGRFAPLLSLARAKNGIHAVFRLSVCASRKLQGMDTAGILPAIHADFGPGVFAARKPQELVTAGIHAGLK
jgi:hypothetical protein